MQVRKPKSDEEFVFCAELIAQSLPQFYGSLPGGPTELIEALVDQFDDPTSELAEPWVVVDEAIGDQILACACIYSASEMPDRQMASLLGLARSLDDAEEVILQAEHFARRIPKQEPKGTYLARIAVAPNMRRRGFARRFLLEMHAAGRIGNTLSLHVDSRNTPAINLYRSIGLRYFGFEDYEFALMWGQIQGET